MSSLKTNHSIVKNYKFINEKSNLNLEFSLYIKNKDHLIAYGVMLESALLEVKEDIEELQQEEIKNSHV